MERSWRRWTIALALGGIALLALGAVLLSVEITVFRWTTQDHDFTGLTCGTPIDHPSWATGEPCAGAVSRQTAIAAVTLLQGIAAIVAGIVLRSQRPRSTSPSPHADRGWTDQ